MILELLSFLPMIHEDMKIGKAGMEIERKATETFRSTDTFWEGIYRAWKNGARDFKINGKLKHISLTEQNIKLNLVLEKSSPKTVLREKEVVWEFAMNDKYRCANSEYKIYNTNGEMIRKYCLNEINFNTINFYALNWNEKSCGGTTIFDETRKVK